MSDRFFSSFRPSGFDQLESTPSGDLSGTTGAPTASSAREVSRTLPLRVEKVGTSWYNSNGWFTDGGDLAHDMAQPPILTVFLPLKKRVFSPPKIQCCEKYW